MKPITKQKLTEMLGTFIRVKNAPSRNGYGEAPNQFILTFERGEVFQSYSTLIGACIRGEYYLTSSHDCSNTTSAHCGRWCGMSAKERRKGLENGTIVLIED